MSLNNCVVLNLPRFTNAEGNLSFIESHVHVPFAIQRVYYLYDVPQNAQRGAHGHRDLQQILIALAGSFHVFLDDGYKKKSFILDSPSQGLYICPMIWRDLAHFSSNAVCLVLASAPYDENDYFRDKEVFYAAARGEL